ncbi:MAG TPA: ATP-binding cassette domain-containing protein [Ramlibacter sp.]|nr:ATP-binding cassette domain-containing protein [Ramlibacter sp.]
MTVDLLPLPPGLIALTGDEGSGKTSCLRRLCGDLPPLPGHAPCADAMWLDLTLPSHDQQTTQQVWDSLRPKWPRWNTQLQQELAQALDLPPHEGKKLFMLSRGSRRKVALVALLASGATVTCLDQPFAALDAQSIEVIRDFLGDMADHATRSWIIADYEADPRLQWRRHVSLD